MIFSELLVSFLTKGGMGKLTDHWMNLFPTVTVPNPSEEQSSGEGNQPVKPCSTDSHITIRDNIWSSGYVYIRKLPGAVEAVLLNETVSET